MPQAFLIAGDSQKFLDEIQYARSFLKREAGVYIKQEFGTAYASEDMTEVRLSMAVAQRTKDPLLILFCGHGGKGGWSFDEDRTLTYSALAELLTRGRRPVLIVNDCCHAMALTAELGRARVSPARVSLIAACEADATALVRSLVPQVIHCWRQRRSHHSGPKTRWGAELDHHFFARPPEPPAPP